MNSCACDTWQENWMDNFTFDDETSETVLEKTVAEERPLKGSWGFEEENNMFKEAFGHAFNRKYWSEER